MTNVAFTDTKVEMTQLVLPTHTNALGTIFGGQVAAWIDVAAAISAQRFTRGLVVTASMDQLDFIRPVMEGSIVVLRSQVNRAWNTSMEVGVLVEREDLTSGERETCCKAYLTFVAVDEEGKTRKVPALDLLEDPVATRRHEEAKMRRDARLALRAQRAERFS